MLGINLIGSLGFTHLRDSEVTEPVALFGFVFEKIPPSPFQVLYTKTSVYLAVTVACFLDRAATSP